MSTQPLLQRTAQKRIALPVKVEPKVFFANERSKFHQRYRFGDVFLVAALGRRKDIILKRNADGRCLIAFLSWLHFTVVLGGLSVGLLNFGDKVCFLDPYIIL